jgi:hypothetical protein
LLDIGDLPQQPLFLVDSAPLQFLDESKIADDLSLLLVVPQELQQPLLVLLFEHVDLVDAGGDADLQLRQELDHLI